MTLKIAGIEYKSNLLIGSGKYQNLEQAKIVLEASKADIITVAIKRIDTNNNKKKNILDIIDFNKHTVLPNTAGCYTADDAIRICKLARELLDGKKLVKLEVLGDPKTLYPNVVDTLKAAEKLVSLGFDIMVYTNDDPIVAKQLEEIGCIAIMPLASFIGSGMGIKNPDNIRLIIENSKVPVLIDAGLGCASDACMAMELGCDGVLINSAIALAKNPPLMAEAIKYAVIAGRLNYISGRMKKNKLAQNSSPKNTPFS